MRIGRVSLELLEWLPILVMPLAVYWLTEGFTESLSPELWLILGVALLVNLGWISLLRSNRRMVDFYEKYTGFRMRK